MWLWLWEDILLCTLTFQGFSPLTAKWQLSLRQKTGRTFSWDPFECAHRVDGLRAGRGNSLKSIRLEWQTAPNRPGTSMQHAAITSLANVAGNDIVLAVGSCFVSSLNGSQTGRLRLMLNQHQSLLIGWIRLRLMLNQHQRLLIGWTRLRLMLNDITDKSGSAGWTVA